MSRAMRRGLLGIGVMLLLGVACTSAAAGPPQEPLGPVPVLDDLGGVEQFKARFNRDRGQTRILLLLSPT